MKTSNKKNKSSFIGRRDLLKSMLAFSAAPAFVSARLMGANSPADRVTLGCIGMGGQGTYNNLVSFLREQDAQVVSVCDVFDDRRERALKIVNKKYHASGCKSFVDFRKIIDDKSIDAVVISTPDHWHVPISLMALAAGKDVFCEKPTLTIAEGRALINEVKKRKAVFQVGLEDRSVPVYFRMIELIRNGAIGKVEKIQVKLPCGYNHPAEAPAPVPKGLNYNLWVGPAPFKPFSPHRTNQKNWRMISDYANGSLVDWGSHLVDTAQLGANAPGVCPVEVEGTGVIPTGRMSNVPISFDVRYRYSNGVKLYVKSGPKPGGPKGCADIRFTGSKGWIGNQGWRGKMEASDKKILQLTYKPRESRYCQKPPGEHRNFLDCFKSGKPTTYTAETMHLLHVTLHMGIIAIRLGRKLIWNPKTETFLNDDKANRMRSRTAREDWKSA